MLLKAFHEIFFLLSIYNVCPHKLKAYLHSSMYIIVQTSDFLKKIYIIAVVMLRVGQLFRTIISFIENQFLSEQIYDNQYNLKY